MFFKQYYLACLSHASYMIADETTREAVVVDPQRDVDPYLADAAAQGFRIRYVILTHFHADFLAGHLELRNRAGVEVVLGARAQAEFAFKAMHDGETLSLGDVRLQILETPGHTPEGISLLVFDPAYSATEPKAVLTGDTLFIGDVGRPDLLASVGVTADDLADMLYHSIQRLRALPDAVEVYPAHGAGSLCGKNISTSLVSTIGEQKQVNYAMQPLPLEQFKEMVTRAQPEAPGYFVYDAMKNREEHAGLTQVLEDTLQPLDIDAVLAMQAAGATLLDVRSAPDFAAGHVRGSLNIGLTGSFATWCGTMLDPQSDLVLIADPGTEREAATRLGRIGYDRVRGYLDGGVEVIRGRADVIATLPRVTSATLAALLGTSQAPLVVDVRNAAERERGHIAGSTHIPLPHLAEQVDTLRGRGPIQVHCQSGYRSSIAASVLLRAGLDDVRDLVGGYTAWAAETGAAAPTTFEGASCGTAPSACATTPARSPSSSCSG